LLWLNVAGCQDVIVWHVVQSVENPVWGGAAAFANSCAWQAVQVGEIGRNLFPAWHCTQETAACAPRRGNPVFAWSNDPPNPRPLTPHETAFTAWQLWQSVPRPVWRWFGACVAL